MNTPIDNSLYPDYPVHPVFGSFVFCNFSFPSSMDHGPSPDTGAPDTGPHLQSLILPPLIRFVQDFLPGIRGIRSLRQEGANRGAGGDGLAGMRDVGSTLGTPTARVTDSDILPGVEDALCPGTRRRQCGKIRKPAFTRFDMPVKGISTQEAFEQLKGSRRSGFTSNSQGTPSWTMKSMPFNPHSPRPSTRAASACPTIPCSRAYPRERYSRTRQRAALQPGLAGVLAGESQQACPPAICQETGRSQVALDEALQHLPLHRRCRTIPLTDAPATAVVHVLEQIPSARGRGSPGEIVSGRRMPVPCRS